MAWRSNRSEIVLAQSAVPVVLAPNGTVAANGVLTLVTPLPMVYTTGAWVRLPAGAVVGGAAGLYWVTFGSATTGYVRSRYADPASVFVPAVPDGPTAYAVGTGVAYAQTLGADITLANITVPGGLMGPNGTLRITVLDSQNNSATSKLHSARFGATMLHGRGRTTSFVEGYAGVVRNRGGQAFQMTSLNQYPGEPVQAGAGNYAVLGVNTALNQPLTVCGQLAAGADYIVLEAVTVEVMPG